MSARVSFLPPTGARGLRLAALVTVLLALLPSPVVSDGPAPTPYQSPVAVVYTYYSCDKSGCLPDNPNQCKKAVANQPLDQLKGYAADATIYVNAVSEVNLVTRDNKDTVSMRTSSS